MSQGWSAVWRQHGDLPRIPALGSRTAHLSPVYFVGGRGEREAQGPLGNHFSDKLDVETLPLSCHVE